MKKNELLNQDYTMDLNTLWVNFKQFIIIPILIVFSNIDGHAQEISSETINTKEREIALNYSDSILIVRADSLKRVEGKRLYMTPVGTLKENKENSNPNPPPTRPKNK